MRVQRIRKVRNKQTPLYDFHIANGARIVPFVGWDMPLQYKAGIRAEHINTRQHASLFDVSHMAQIELSGTGADTLLEKLTPTDLNALEEGKMRYSLFLNETGGILDDLMISKLDGNLHLVVNAGRANHDINHLLHYIGKDTRIKIHEGRALLALQGPESANVLTSLGLDLKMFHFMEIRHFNLCNVPTIISRSGYTGEDGFEISIPNESAVKISDLLLSTNMVRLAGLGARDTLRIEAGLPLWGNELNESITPNAAGLTFAISKKRRKEANFPGANLILDELADGPSRCLVGLMAEGARPVRGGIKLADDGDNEVGIVTSGSFSPSLERPAAIGFVASPYAAPGTQLKATTKVGETLITVTKLPLVPHRYFRF